MKPLQELQPLSIRADNSGTPSTSLRLAPKNAESDSRSKTSSFLFYTYTFFFLQTSIRAKIFIEDLTRGWRGRARRLLILEEGEARRTIRGTNSFLPSNGSVLVRRRNGLRGSSRVLARQRPLLPSRHSPDTKRFLRFCFQRNRGSRACGGTSMTKVYARYATDVRSPFESLFQTTERDDASGPFAAHP